MKKIYFSALLVTLLSAPAFSQVVVKMELPPQSADPIEATTLFEETLPLNIPSVLGPMGYEITGGTPPYTFRWLENDVLLSGEEIAVITPATGNIYEVVILDENSCSVTLPIQTGGGNVSAEERVIPGQGVAVFFSPAENLIRVRFTGDPAGDFRLGLYDLKGVSHLERTLYGDTDIPVSLRSGVYLVHIQGEKLKQTEKIVIP